MNPIIEFLLSLFGAGGRGLAPAPTPTAAPTATPTPDQLAEAIRIGMEEFGAPMATMSSELAEGGRRLAEAVPGEGNYGIPQEYLPAIKTLKESSGLKKNEKGTTDTARRTNNPFGMLAGGQYISFPNLRAAILGEGGNGTPRGYVSNILNSGYYDDYLQSGDIRDLMKHYTPADDPRNNALNQQIKTMQQLSNYFIK